MGGAEPINILQAVHDYCQLMEITNEDDKEDLLILITALDDCWLEHHNEEREKKRNGDKKPHTPFKARR